MEHKHGVDQFLIAGVTFEGRQALLAELQPNDVLVLEREPWNPFDPAAVRVDDLRGRTLGYVPRKEGANTAFEHEQSFGLVASVGPPKDKPVLGARFYARPRLPALTLDPLPPAEAARYAPAALPAVFGPRWEMLQLAARGACNYRCCLSGVGEGQLPLALLPVWRYHAAARAVQLVRLACVCGPLAEAKGRLEAGVMRVVEGGGDREGAFEALAASRDGWLLQEVNGLDATDTAAYLARVAQRGEALAREGWRVEVLM